VLRTAGLGPAEAEERLGAWLGREGLVTVSCVVVDGDVWVRLLARAPSRALAEAALAEAEPPLRAALGADCYSADGQSLEEAVGALLRTRGLTVSTAESCTGGLVAHRLTNIPGSSRYVERGVVVYSNEAKEELLGVPRDLLKAHGAVSAPVAEAMVRGVCRVGHTGLRHRRHGDRRGRTAGARRSRWAPCSSRSRARRAWRCGTSASRAAGSR
jgi:nicotinamide-nucleotide amidase